MCKKLMFLISLVLLLGLVNSAYAGFGDGIFWIGGHDVNSWCDGENWVGGVVPGPEDQADINCPPERGPVIDCDVNVGIVLGPRWDSDTNQVMDVNSGTAVFHGWRWGDGGKGTAFINISGGDLIVYNYPGQDWAVRGTDKGKTVWNQTGGTVTLPHTRARFADSGPTLTTFNISGGSFSMQGELKCGDDGDVVINLSGDGNITAHKGPYEPGGDEFDGNLTFECRRGSNCTANISDTASMVLDGTAFIGRRGYKNGSPPGTGTLNMNGGTLTANEIDMGYCEDGDGSRAVINMNAGLITVGTLNVPKHEKTALALVTIVGGTIEANELNLAAVGKVSFNSLVGTLVLDGDVVPQIEAAVENGRMGSYYSPSDGIFRMPEVVVDYGVRNVGKTTVSGAEPDWAKAWAPNPADGHLYGPVKGLLCWKAGNYVDMHVVYFGTDYDDVNDATDPFTPPGRGFQRADLLCFDPADPPLGPPVYRTLWTYYYWRVDEMGDPSSKGDTWTFRAGCEPIPGDVNKDCILDFKDYALVADTWQMEQMWP